jgi:preprotein translocase subunit SecD
MTIGSTPNSAGIIAIIGACLAVSAIMTVVTGSFMHWPFVLAGLGVGCWAVASINK